MSSQDPRTKAGLYWGYTVRLASCLSKSCLCGKPQRALLDPVRPESLSCQCAVCLGKLPFLLWALVSLSVLPGMMLRTSEGRYHDRLIMSAVEMGVRAKGPGKSQVQCMFSELLPTHSLLCSGVVSS